MTSKAVYLLKFRQIAAQRAHFAVYIPDGKFPGKGTLINVIGAPMIGFQLVIKTDYDLSKTIQAYRSISLGTVLASSVAAMKQLANNVRPPGISQNFMAPVDGVKNKRCQEWTVEYIQLLIQHGILGQDTLHTVQSQRDPPNHGVGLQPVG